MMTLDEAIAHAKEMAKLNRTGKLVVCTPCGELEYKREADCINSAEEYEQLVSWFEELQERREADRWISVSEKLPDRHISVIATDNNDVFVAWYNEGWNSSDSQFDKHAPIVAWKPIPQYTESEGST